MLYGYARNRNELELDNQRAVLESYGVESSSLLNNKNPDRQKKIGLCLS